MAPTWDELTPLLPPELRRWVLADVTWDPHKLWSLDLPTRESRLPDIDLLIRRRGRLIRNVRVVAEGS